MLNNTKDILTLKELQVLLHIGKNTALRLVQSGEIEAFRVGKQWRIENPVEASPLPVSSYVATTSKYDVDVPKTSNMFVEYATVK